MILEGSGNQFFRSNLEEKGGGAGGGGGGRRRGGNKNKSCHKNSEDPRNDLQASQLYFLKDHENIALISTTPAKKNNVKGNARRSHHTSNFKENMQWATGLHEGADLPRAQQEHQN